MRRVRSVVDDAVLAAADRLYLLVHRHARSSCVPGGAFRGPPSPLCHADFQQEVPDAQLLARAMQLLRDDRRVCFEMLDFFEPGRALGLTFMRVTVRLPDVSDSYARPFVTVHWTLAPRGPDDLPPERGRVHEAMARARLPAPDKRRTVVGEKFLAVLKDAIANGQDPAEVLPGPDVPDVLQHKLIFNRCRWEDLQALVAHARTQLRDVDDVLADVIMAGLVALKQENRDG